MKPRIFIFVNQQLSVPLSALLLCESIWDCKNSNILEMKVKLIAIGS